MSAAVALIRLRAYAYAHDRRLRDVAGTWSPDGYDSTLTRTKTAVSVESCLRVRPRHIRWAAAGRRSGRSTVRTDSAAGAVPAQTDQGPCVDCYRTGQPVSVADLTTAGRWPRFTVAAAEVGFAAVHAVPMRLRAEVIGALNLFDTTPGPLDEGRLRIVQALADVATIGLFQQRAIHRREVLTEQLETALRSRVLIEQAKGVLAERLHLDMAAAFTLLRDNARSHNRRLSDLAQAVVNGTEQILPATAASPPH